MTTEDTTEKQYKENQTHKTNDTYREKKPDGRDETSDPSRRYAEQQSGEKKKQGKRYLTLANLQKYLLNLIFLLVAFTLCLLIFMLIYNHEGVTSGIQGVLYILRPVIFGLAIAYVMNPVMRFFERKLEPALQKKIKNERALHRTNRVLSMLIAFAILIGIVVFLLMLVIPQTVESISGLLVSLPPRIEGWIRVIHEKTATMGDAGSYIDKGIDTVVSMVNGFDASNMLGMAQSVIGGVIGGVQFVLHLIIGVIIAVNVLGMKELLQSQCKKVIYAIFKARPANVILEVGRKADEVFSSFIIGKLIDSAIIGVICYVGVLIMGMPNPLLIALIVGVTNVIPFFGPIFGAIPACLLVFLQEPLKALWLLIFIIILQQLDGNVIGPKILGDSTGLPPFWVLVAILLFGGIWGVAGMLLGVPLMALIQYVLHRLFGALLRRKGYTEETEDYQHLHAVDPDSGQMIYTEEERETGDASK